MSEKEEGKIEIHHLNWEEINWDDLDFKRVDARKLNVMQLKMFRRLRKEQKKKTRKERENQRRINKEKRRMKVKEELKKFRIQISWEEKFSGSKIFGDLPIVMSKFRHKTELTKVKYLNTGMTGENVIIRARIHKRRVSGKGLVFIILREGYHSIQSVGNSIVSEQLVHYCSNIPIESIVEVHGEVCTLEHECEFASQKNVELSIKRIYGLSISRNKSQYTVENLMNTSYEFGIDQSRHKRKRDLFIDQRTRLDLRFLDLRVPAHNAIFRINSVVCNLFREFLTKNHFMEIHSPRLVSGSIDGTKLNETFKITKSGKFENYFTNKNAYLLSRHLRYKQMCIQSDFERVFEIGPLFSGWMASSARHLTQFTGMDFEMRIQNNHREVIRMLIGLLRHIFKSLEVRCKEEIEVVRKQYPFDPLSVDEDIILSHNEAVRILEESEKEKRFGIQFWDHIEWDVHTLRKLGKILKEKFGTDCFIIDQIPLHVCPFFCMPSPKKRVGKAWEGNNEAKGKESSNSFIVVMRGQRIASGCQKIHDSSLLIERAKRCIPDIKIESNEEKQQQDEEVEGENDEDEKIEDTTSIHVTRGPRLLKKNYLDCFRYGSWAHGGVSMGLERFVMNYLSLGNIRKCSLFPRTPDRLNP